MSIPVPCSEPPWLIAALLNKPDTLFSRISFTEQLSMVYNQFSGFGICPGCREAQLLLSGTVEQVV